ncbi:MAG: hypothetical protein GY932_15430 [Arcobacter sp.]|nr:hypothetical protein [Flavobacteriaceae bacterium]MCP4971967.1 hypothetical protein [Arcobacter sp.]
MFNKQVFAYWDNENELPILERKCLDSWKNNLDSSWKINLLRKSNLQNYLDKNDLPSNFDELDSAQRRSDAVRLALLSKYGGIYLDCSVILRENLDWVQKVMKKENLSFFAETHDPLKRTHSVWFLAALPDSKFMRSWSKTANNEMENIKNLKYDRIQNLSPEIRDGMSKKEQNKIGFIDSSENGLVLVKGKLNLNSGPIENISYEELKKHENKLGHKVRLIKLNRNPRNEVREFLKGKKSLKNNSAIVQILKENQSNKNIDRTKSTNIKLLKINETEEKNGYLLVVTLIFISIAILLFFIFFSYNKRNKN